MEAERNLEKSLEREMDLERLFPLRGVYLQLELHALALRAYRQIVKRNPNHPLITAVRGVIAENENVVASFATDLDKPQPVMEDMLRLLEEGQIVLSELPTRLWQWVTHNRDYFRIKNNEMTGSSQASPFFPLAVVFLLILVAPVLTGCSGSNSAGINDDRQGASNPFARGRPMIFWLHPGIYGRRKTFTSRSMRSLKSFSAWFKID